MIDKETFIDTINLLEVIVRKDMKNIEIGLLTRKIFTLLPLCFPDSEKADIEIEDYCLFNFGKPTPDSEYTTPGELYEKLI